MKSWQFGTERARDAETLRELVGIGDLREVVDRLSARDYQETSETLRGYIRDALSEGHYLTAYVLLEQISGIPSDTLAEAVQKRTGRISHLLSRIKAGKLVRLEEVYLLQKWLESAGVLEGVVSESELEHLFGSNYEDYASSQGATRRSYKLAEWTRDGGGSGVAIQYVREYHLELQLEGSPAKVKEWRIRRQRYRESEYGID